MLQSYEDLGQQMLHTSEYMNNPSFNIPESLFFIEKFFFILGPYTEYFGLLKNKQVHCEYFQLDYHENQNNCPLCKVFELQTKQENISEILASS